MEQYDDIMLCPGWPAREAKVVRVICPTYCWSSIDVGVKEGQPNAVEQARQIASNLYNLHYTEKHRPPAPLWEYVV